MALFEKTGMWPCWNRYGLIGGSVSLWVGLEVPEVLSLPAVCQSDM